MCKTVENTATDQFDGNKIRMGAPSLNAFYNEHDKFNLTLIWLQLSNYHRDYLDSRHMGDVYEWYIIPMINPDGYQYSFDEVSSLSPFSNVPSDSVLT